MACGRTARAALLTTGAYAWCPTFVSYAMFVMPDIWCVIGVAVLLAVAQDFAEHGGRKALAWCVVVSIALTLLKPSNIYIAIWWVVIAMALLLRRNRRWWRYLVPAFAMAVVLGGYGLLVQRLTGYYTVSVVSDINDLGNAAQRRKLPNWLRTVPPPTSFGVSMPPTPSPICGDARWPSLVPSR